LIFNRDATGQPVCRFNRKTRSRPSWGKPSGGGTKSIDRKPVALNREVISDHILSERKTVVVNCQGDYFVRHV
jgi:hypothetical protein